YPVTVLLTGRLSSIITKYRLTEKNTPISTLPTLEQVSTKPGLQWTYDMLMIQKNQSWMNHLEIQKPENGWRIMPTNMVLSFVIQKEKKQSPATVMSLGISVMLEQKLPTKFIQINPHLRNISDMIINSDNDS